MNNSVESGKSDRSKTSQDDKVPISAQFMPRSGTLDVAELRSGIEHGQVIDYFKAVKIEAAGSGPLTVATRLRVIFRGSAHENPPWSNWKYELLGLTATFQFEAYACCQSRLHQVVAAPRLTML